MFRLKLSGRLGCVRAIDVHEPVVRHVGVTEGEGRATVEGMLRGPCSRSFGSSHFLASEEIERRGVRVSAAPARHFLGMK